MNETVRTTLNVDDKGSLSLTNLNSSMSCTYKVEHRDIHGKFIVTKTETLCVLSRAPVPKLAVKCSSAGVATLHCEHESITSFTLTWLHNNKDLREKSNPFQPKQHGEKDHYRCRLSNSLDKQDSKEVPISCGVSDKCTEKLEGDSHSITLNSAKQKGDELIWKCNDTVIYQRIKEKVQSTVNVDDKGSLSLANLNSSMSCTYKAEHHDIHGKLIATKTERLCVLPRAPVPKLAVKCSSAGVATLRCEHESITSFTLTWLHNNKDLREKSNPFQPKQHGEKDHYRCRLSNSLDKQDSKEVTISCGVSGSGLSDDKLICIKKQVMLVILAGVGFLLLVLTLSLVIVSCKNCGHQKRKHDNEELRLCYLKDTSTDPQQLKQAAPEDYCNIRTPEMEPVPAACQPSAEPQPVPAEKAPGTPGTSGTPVPQPRRKLNLIPKS
ncbi:uncharacterized protein LOC143142470 isoform X2 [Alosa pseudoharengus]